MFSNPGGKLRIIGYIAMGLQILLAVLLVIGGCILMTSGGGGVLLIYAAVVLVSAWVSAISYLALADAAEGAQEANENALEIIRMLQEMKRDKGTAGNTGASPEAAGPVAAPTNPDGKIPAWQRIEMEKEAAQKAETK